LALGLAAQAQIPPTPRYSGVIFNPQSGTPATTAEGLCWSQTNTGLYCYYNGSAHGPFSTSSGTVTTTGSPASGNLTQFSGASSITNGNLSGDATTSNTLVVTVGKVHGVTYPASPSTNTVPVVTSSNTVTYEAVPNAALAFSATTVNGQTCTLGASCTVSAAASSLTVGSTTISGGSSGRALYDNAGVLGELVVATGATATSLAQRDANANLLANINFMNTASTGSAGGTTTLTAASAQYQILTGSANQTFQLPDATTMSLGPSFIFNNNSSGTLTINDASSTPIYAAPGGGVVEVELLQNSNAAGVWVRHPKPPSTVTWGSQTTGLVMNTVLDTTAQISADVSSSTVPVFLPQRGTSNTGFGGDSTHTYSIVGGTAAISSTSAGTSIPNLTATGSFTATGLVTNADLANSSITVAGHSVSLGGSTTIACGDLSNGATGCSTATGTSGATIPLLNGTNTWSGVQSFNDGDLALKGSSSGTVTLKAAAAAGSNTLTFPAGTTNFSATGGTSQVVKQTSSGGAFTVGQLATTDISGTITDNKCLTWDSTLAVTAQTVKFAVPWTSYTVTTMQTAVSGGGSFTVAAKINGTDITSLSAVSVSGTSNTNTASTGANTGSANDQISIVTSSPSGTVNTAYVCLVFTHSLN